MREPLASYTNPITHTEIGGTEEKVVKVEGTTVHTRAGNRYLRYDGVTHPALSEGDMVRERIRCRSVSMRIAWNPFDEADDDE